MNDVFQAFKPPSTVNVLAQARKFFSMGLRKWLGDAPTKLNTATAADLFAIALIAAT